MDSTKSYKDRAIESLNGKWGMTAIATLIYILIYGGMSCTLSFMKFELLGNIVQIILLPIAWGFTIMFLEISRNEGNEPDLGKMFDGFKDYPSCTLL